MNRKTITGILMNIFFIVIAFIYLSSLWCFLIFLIIHELAHFLTGWMLGYTFKSVSVLPFGITFGFKEEFIKPLDDIMISISGPLINFLFYVLFLFIQKHFYIPLNTLININMALFLFNLIPADFLDGGRILKNFFSCYLGFYAGHVLTTITGCMFGIFLVVTSSYSMFIEFGPAKLSLFLLGGFFIFKGFSSISRITFKTIGDVVHKQIYLYETKNIRILSRGYCPETKILDIIKKFCFNKYYVIYIIEKGYLRYNINEMDIIKVFYTHGNISLGECAIKITAQEGYNG